MQFENPTEKWPSGIPGLDRTILKKWMTKYTRDSVDQVDLGYDTDKWRKQGNNFSQKLMEI